MKLSLTSTTHQINIVTESGDQIPVRLWQGNTEKGVPCHALILAIGVDKNDDQSEFDQDEHEQAQADAQAFAAELLAQYSATPQRPC